MYQAGGRGVDMCDEPIRPRETNEPHHRVAHGFVVATLALVMLHMLLA